MQFHRNRPRSLSARSTDYVYATDPKIRVDQRKLALIVGLVALGLPTCNAFGNCILGACFYDSISHYYYAQFWGDVFVGSLIFIGTFMIAYRGGNPAESNIATFRRDLRAYCCCNSN